MSRPKIGISKKRLGGWMELDAAVQLLQKIVAFPNRKSFIFDNKLDFSGIKLAES